MNLIDSFWKYDRYVRAVRVRVSNLKSLERVEQLSFFNEETNNLTKSIQIVKDKYGADKIHVASDTVSFINRKSKSEESSQY